MGSLFLFAAVIIFGIIFYKLIRRKLALRGHEIKADDALQLYDSNQYILDVRTVEEYKEGHIPGIKLLPLSELGRRYKELPTDREVYIMCRSGSRSAEATVWLLKKGYTNVFNISGGMSRWKGPIEK